MKLAALGLVVAACGHAPVSSQEHRDRTVRIGVATVRVTGTRIFGCIRG